MTDHEYYVRHSGIKNMKWGQRRWQNKDGSLTPAGRIRYRKLRGKGTHAKGSNTKQTNVRQSSQNEKKYTSIGTATRVSKMAMKNPKRSMKLSMDLTEALLSDYAGAMKYCKTSVSLVLRNRDRYIKALNEHLDHIKDDFEQVKVDKYFFTSHKNDTVDDILNDGNSAMISFMVLQTMANSHNPHS